MRTGTVSYKLEDLKKGVIIPIGFVGENDFTRVIFDAEEIYKKFPNASVSMKVQPPKGVIYPATVTRDGNTVIWQVKEADVANRGGGELQLTFTDGETKIKTYIARTDVKRSLAGNGHAPDPVQDWVDNAEEVLDDLAAMDNIAKTAEAGDVGKALSPKTVENGVVTEWQFVEPGAGTDDYADLDNKPSIAGVTLSGNKTLEDLGIAADDDLDNLAGEVSDVKTALDGKISKPSTEGTSGQVLVSDGNGGQVWGTTGQGTIVVDDTLSVSGAAADSAKVGDLKSALIDPYLVEPFTWVDTYYVNASTGAVASSNSYSYFATNIKGYMVLEVTSNFGSVTGICLYDKNDNFLYGVGNATAGVATKTIIVPENAVTLKVSCVKNSKSSVSIKTPMRDVNSLVVQRLNEKAELPHLHEYVSYTETRGITKKDLTVYDEGAEYMGRTTHISVTPGDVYLISGRSTSANYPCAQYVNSSNVVTELLGGSSVTYSNERVTIPEGAVTLYINGSASIPIGIVKIVQMTQDEFDSYFSNEQSQNCPLKALYKNGVLSVKRKHDATHDLVLTFGNVGGNSLFNFRSAYYIANSDDYPSDSFDEASATAVWTMSGTDWLGPYTVSANQNADGDAPTDVYFTGGNHRTTNTGTGGGVTAVQNSLSILIDGNKAIQENVVMPCRFAAAKWQNTVQAYNTSKANGSGRGVLTENWVMEITENDVKVHNTITALENITLETYYGLQASCSGKNYRYIGGENRGVYAIGTDTINSGNNTCRTVELSDTNFTLDMTVEPIDLGLFENNKGWSFFPSATKMYAYLVAPDHEIVIETGEKYDVFGWYEFK